MFSFPFEKIADPIIFLFQFLDERNTLTILRRLDRVNLILKVNPFPFTKLQLTFNIYNEVILFLFKYVFYHN